MSEVYVYVSYDTYLVRIYVYGVGMACELLSAGQEKLRKGRKVEQNRLERNNWLILKNIEKDNG